MTELAPGSAERSMTPSSEDTMSVQEARAAYERAIVFDASIAPLMTEEYIDRLHRSGVTAVNWTVCRPWSRFGEATAEIARGLEIIQFHRHQLTLARTVAEIEAAKRNGQVAIVFGPQNALPGEEHEGAFRILHELGVRIVQLTYNERNAFGDGSSEAANAGLSKVGLAAVAELNRLGIVIDVSHCGDRTTIETVEASEAPVVVTHANCRALHGSARNKTDEAIRAIADKGGVLGLTLFSIMLRHDRRPTLEDFLRQVSYAADLIGIDHIGIGSDHSEGAPRDRWELEFGINGKYPKLMPGVQSWYGYDVRFAEGGSSVSDFPSVAEALAGLGLSPAELSGVLGGNFLRVFRQVWGS